MKQGDLLVSSRMAYGAGKRYGEMFGEERLVDLIERNAHRSEDQIIELVLSSRPHGRRRRSCRTT